MTIKTVFRLAHVTPSPQSRLESMVPASLLHEIFLYETETGVLFWKARDASWFADHSRAGVTGAMKRWNTVYAGKRAFTPVDGSGYFWGSVKRIRCKAHQVVWALHMGVWPDGQIDHVNGVRTDNRIENLRCVSKRDNARNTKIYASNTSGVIGVFWHSKRQRWVARINTDTGRKTLGEFFSFEKAVEARRKAERAHNYHENHGRAA